ncbi:hypothetical protein AB837_00605 [bacterium AB1]|nr:hypothetical protein AB837_00605 [bacterium AB1]
MKLKEQIADIRSKINSVKNLAPREIKTDVEDCTDKMLASLKKHGECNGNDTSSTLEVKQPMLSSYKKSLSQQIELLENQELIAFLKTNKDCFNDFNNAMKSQLSVLQNNMQENVSKILSNHSKLEDTISVLKKQNEALLKKQKDIKDSEKQKTKLLIKTEKVLTKRSNFRGWWAKTTSICSIVFNKLSLMCCSTLYAFVVSYCYFNDNRHEIDFTHVAAEHSELLKQLCPNINITHEEIILL